MNSELNNFTTAIEKAEIMFDPFLHIHTENVFSDEYYNSVLENLPPIELWVLSIIKTGSRNKRHVFWPGDWKEEPFYAYENDIFQSFVDILHSTEVIEKIATKFKLKENEYCSQSQLFWDTIGFSILPHPDTKSKIVTMQIPLCENNDYAIDSAMHLCTKKEGVYKKDKIIEFKRNTLSAFKRTERSYHTVSSIKNPKRIQVILRLRLYEDTKASKFWLQKRKNT